MTQHIPVLVDEVLQLLDPQPGQWIADGTFGGGGHTRLLAERVAGMRTDSSVHVERGDLRTAGRVLALDADPAAIAAGEQGFASLPVSLFCRSYADLPELLGELQVPAVDGILLDLGLSSDQLADPDRGFSFAHDGPIDLRFNPHQGVPAGQLVNRLSAEHLADLIYRYGEERLSRRIARAIVAERHRQPIETASQLAEIIRRCVPGSVRRARIDPATRTFQALRIAVNEELKWLEVALNRLPDCLKPGGRLAIISFHSLEDRLVKSAFRQDDKFDIITRKPVRPSEAEVARNPRCRSARLRVAQRRPS